MEFIKYQALGNDYLVYSSHKTFELTHTQIQRVCNRNLGLGSDGILVMERQGATPVLRIFNPDGSEAEKSGNGLRIFSRYLWDSNLVSDKAFEIITKGGNVISRVLEQGRLIEVSMGKANFRTTAVNMSVEIEEALNFPLKVLKDTIKINVVSMGNPHCVVFLDDISADTTKRLGPLIETNPIFKYRTNVQFVKVIDRKNIQIQIWERGAGYTLSSGTSSCAAASVAIKLGYCDTQLKVHMPGGVMNISSDDNYNMTMLGPVTRIAEMKLNLECFL